MLLAAGGAMRLQSISPCVLLPVLGACASSEAPGTANADVKQGVRLEATPYNEGEVARATLIRGEGRTSIGLIISGVPSDVTLPVHIYTYIHEGTCGNMQEMPVYSLNEVVLPSAPGGRIPMNSRGPFTLSKVAPLPLEELMSGRYSLVLRSAPADGHQIIFCGVLSSR
jgi:hypothetical protein